MADMYYEDLLDLDPIDNNDLNLINIRGCNGSGKSTIPMLMIDSDPLAFDILYNVGGKYKTLGVVLPSYKSVVIGHYRTKCGGMDTIKDTQGIKDAVKYLWKLNYHLIMEGIMASTVRQTYIDLFNGLNQEEKFTRNIVIYNILPPLQVCLDRIQKRNGGKAIDNSGVENKWKTVQRNAGHFSQAGFISLLVDNSQVEYKDTISWFLDAVNSQVDTLSKIPFHKQIDTFTDVQELSKEEPEKVELIDDVYIEPEDNIKDYPWFKKYKAPNGSVKIKKEYMDNFWGFIAERMNIYWKRVVEKQPAPWTEDKILRDYKFTNVLRDMDRLSIYERKNILAKIDEPTNNLKLRKMSILLNIMMFRLWVKIDTYEVHGFIDLENPNWRADWERAKEVLLKRREDGISNFTAAYYVNDLHAANPDKSTQNNKTINAICMLESFMDNIEEIYHNAIEVSKNMKEQLEYFQTLTCVGAFTAYEYACSITMVTRYYKNHLVNWDQDNDTNVGPGARRGLDWIFEDLGGMSYYQAILYLRSIWKHELQKRGTYDRFVSQLPKELGGDIDLRVIEHSLCETQKYNKALTNTGRPKESFKPKTIDVDSLLV